MSLLKNKWVIIFGSILLITIAINFIINRPLYPIGTVIDQLNGVKVYYNGKTSNVVERNVTKDGYNLGLKYQCVEFVKRYYYQYFGHKMPDNYGHAKSFYNSKITSGSLNPARGLIQYKNGSVKPQIHDLVVFDGYFGHVAIISNVTDNEIEIIQQNSGVRGKTRDHYHLLYDNNTWTIDNSRILGFLRLPENAKPTH